MFATQAIADAERLKEVKLIKIQENILEKEGDQNISSINNNIIKQKEENLANIHKYKIEKVGPASFWNLNLQFLNSLDF